MKTFKVKTDSGEVDADQLATFTGYVKGRGFRFVVTRLPGHADVRLTHRSSTAAVAHVPHSEAMRTDWEKAGRAALEALIAKHGEDRVHVVLLSAEGRS